MARARGAGLLAMVGTVSFVLAGCGGGGSKKAATTQFTATTAAETTPTSAGTDIAGGSTTTAPGAIESTTTTTAKHTTATTSRVLSVTGNRAGTTTRSNTPAAGLLQVQGTSTTTSSANQPKPGGTLTLLVNLETNGFDPVVISGSGPSGTQATAIFDSLVYNDPSDGTVKTSIADAISSTDGVVWTIKIRPNVLFTDKTPYDATAVKFNWDRHKDPANHSISAGAAASIKTMEVVDPQTLRVTLTSQNNQWPRLVARSLTFIGSPAAIQAKGPDFMSNPVGAGAFMMKSWVRNSAMTLDRNPAYWNAPRPYADQLVIKPISDESQRTNTFLTGGGNLNQTLVADEAAKMRKAGLPEASLTINGGNEIVFNMTKAPFNDVRARRAVVDALDIKKFTTEVLGDYVPAKDSIFKHESPFYDPSTNFPAYNPTEAQRLLDEINKDNGKPLEFTLGAFQTSQQIQTAQWIQAQFSQLKNVKVSIDIAGPAAAQSRVIARNYEAHLWGNPFDDPEPFFATAWSSTGGPSNVTGFSDPRVDAALAAGRTTFDGAQRKDAYKTVAAIISDQVPAWYYQQPYGFIFGAKQIRDLMIFEDGVAKLDGTWIDR